MNGYASPLTYLVLVVIGLVVCLVVGWVSDHQSQDGADEPQDGV